MRFMCLSVINQNKTTAYHCLKAFIDDNDFIINLLLPFLSPFIHEYHQKKSIDLIPIVNEMTKQKRTMNDKKKVFIILQADYVDIHT
jgi:hypothetical protein